MAQTFYQGTGDKKWSTAALWSTAAVPVSGDDAILTDVRTTDEIIGETVTEATFPDNILITKFSGNIGTTGAHLIFDDAAGSETLDSLKIEDATGKIFIDVIQGAGSNTITETRVNVPGQATDQVNLGGAAAWTAVHLIRGRTNLGMSGTVADLWIAHSTTPRDVFCNIEPGATITNIRNESGRVVNSSTNAVTFWMQRGGSSIYQGGNTITDLYVMGGTFRFDGSTVASTVTNLYVYGGTVTFTQTGHLRTATNVFIMPGGTVDMRHVESLVTTVKIEAYGSAVFKGNKSVTRFV